MSDWMDRYQQLNLAESLAIGHLYPFACEELSLILKFAYNQVHKNLQSLFFRDTLTAFRFLPNMQTAASVSACHRLLKSAKAILPKQKKNLAVREFKYAKVALKRRSKAQKEETGSVELPTDILVRIFGFLDIQSLVSSGLVCWSWNFAANDNNLWRRNYSLCFDNMFKDPKSKVLRKEKRSLLQDNTNDQWKEAFRKKFIGCSSMLRKSRRGYCENCYSVVWQDVFRCPTDSCRSNPENHGIRAISPRQVVDYVLEDTFFIHSSSDSDDCSDEDSNLGHWAWWFPRQSS